MKGERIEWSFESVPAPWVGFKWSVSATFPGGRVWSRSGYATSARQARRFIRRSIKQARKGEA